MNSNSNYETNLRSLKHAEMISQLDIFTRRVCTKKKNDQSKWGVIHDT